ncbi:hypothetical protein ASE01_17305 [Nocardioides sp. Root190]|uniref:DUF6188 family protein n=1 Tax=Nocardioides sp. Root190 TaxID=1736488 RepID=UPI0006F9E5F2|nr:DUF6188 family protein [Nocardioides sp. Root190]KRB75116.1 hypothetical protein ASE01_17305 [Nocardioides sp. Root190]
MYGLSPETDLSPLNGCKLTFLGFGRHQVQLAFSGDTPCSVSIEGDYIVTPSGRDATTFNEAVDGAAALLPLLGHAVVFASVPTDGTIRLEFDDGSVIEVLDSSARYESYQVSIGDRLLVV